MLPQINEPTTDKLQNFDISKERFRSNGPTLNKSEALAENQSQKQREKSQKPSKQRLLKIAGMSNKATKKERFNEDAESVAKSVREDMPKKLKYNLIGGDKHRNADEKSLGSNAFSKLSKATSRTQMSKATTLRLQGSTK